MQQILFTIGYEGVTVDALVKTLVDAKVEVVIDVRAVPLSRKPVLSKNELAARLQEAGIRYVGLKHLGTPAEGRHAARKGHIGEMTRIYKTQLESDAAQSEMQDAVKIAQSQPCCLLCFENDPDTCHRKITGDRITAITGQDVVHLNPVHYL